MTNDKLAVIAITLLMLVFWGVCAGFSLRARAWKRRYRALCDDSGLSLEVGDLLTSESLKIDRGYMTGSDGAFSASVGEGVSGLGDSPIEALRDLIKKRDVLTRAGLLGTRKAGGPDRMTHHQRAEGK